MHMQFFDALVNAPVLPLAKFKLQLLLNPVYKGMWLPKDKHRIDKKDTHFIISKHNLAFEVWKHLCRKVKCLSEAELVEVFPEAAEKIQWWGRYIDENGE